MRTRISSIRTRASLARVCALGVVLGLSACASDNASDEPRIVVIGIDGADWKIIDALAAEGELPNLMGLKQRGVSGPIATLNDIALSPVIWTSVATGKTAAKHGIAWFMVDQPDGTRVPVRSHNRKTEAIWNILAQRDMRANVVGWWATYPAEEIGPGMVVSDALGFHGFGSTARDGGDALKTYPAELFGRVDALVPPEQQVSLEFAQRFIHLSAEEYQREMFDPARYPRRDPFNPVHLFQQYAVTAQGYTAIAEELLAQDAYELFMIYFEQVDSFSHLFMKYAPPKLEWLEEADFERYRDVVSQWYRYQDELLGRVLAHIDLETTAVLVLSDHGFKSGERRIRSEELVDIRKAHLDHETDGIFIAAGPRLRRGAWIEGASVLDITPTVLHYLGLPVAKDMDGKVLEKIFEPAFLQSQPLRYVTTYESAGDRVAKDASSESFGSDELAEIEGGLRALGYVGEEEIDESEAEASSPEIHNNLGRIHLRNGELDDASREFQGALALDPNNAEALLNMGAIHQAQGRSDLAQHFAERALQADPNSIGALAQLAEAQRELGRLDEAIRLFLEALAIDDSQPFLYMGLGDVLQRAGRFEDAERAFKSTLELEPDSFKARYNLGVTYSNMGRIEEAMARYEEALEVEPRHPEAVLVHNNMGALLLSQGEADRALERFEKAVESSLGHIESRYNAAIIYRDRGRADEAIDLLEQAVALQPNHEQVNLQLGMAYLDAGRGEDAYRSLLLVRRLYPNNWAATLGLAVLHARAEQPELARGLLEEAVQAGGEAARSGAAAFPALEGLSEG